MKPLTPQRPERIEWEARVLRVLAEKLGCSESDAQDIAEPQADIIARCWREGVTAETCADDIDRASTPADPGRQPDAKAEAIAQADAHLNNVGLPTYTEMILALNNLLTWASYTGGWDAECWDEAKDLCVRIPGAT